MLFLFNELFEFWMVFRIVIKIIFILSYMNFKDIHTDLDTEISPFPDIEKKELSAWYVSDINTSDIRNTWVHDIYLSKWKNIKINKLKKLSIFNQVKFFDGINLFTKKKDINISQPYSNPTQDIKHKIWDFKNNISNHLSPNKLHSHVKVVHTNIADWIKESSDNIKNNASEFFDNNLKKKNHNFKSKRLIKWTSWFSFSWRELINNYQEYSILKKIIVWILIIIFIWTLVKYSIEWSVNSGYRKLASIKNWTISFEYIQKSINDAHFSFVFADFLFKPISLIPNESIQNWYHVIQGGKQITFLWDEFLQFFDWLQKLINKKWIDNIYISQVIKNSKPKFLKFEYILSKTLIHYDKITEIGDIKLQNTFDNTVKKLHNVLGFIKTINLNFEEFLSLMWHYEQRKYLIVFQNNDEIRPTGGFMWSMWIVTVYKWKVISIEKSDVYKYEYEINKIYKAKNESKALAPKWLNKITTTWWLRDSNYRPFIKETAEDIRGFLNKININLDGIVFINKSTIEEILGISWWIDFDLLGMKITDENFSRVISTLVEAKVSKIWTLWTPKQILFDFAELFYREMKQNKDYIPYAKVIFNHLQSRDIIVYSFHPDENSLLWKLNLNGELAFHKTLDFSYPVYTSLSGNKSDRYIQTKYIKNVDLIWVCEYKTNLNIIRKHTYNNLEEDKINILLDIYNIENKFHIKKIQWKADNFQYMRVYLPRSAEVKLQDWMTIQKNNRYTLVDFFMKTRLYETTSYNIEYKVKKDNCNGYSYTLYKQPWIPEYDMNIIINSEKITASKVKKDFIIKR